MPAPRSPPPPSGVGQGLGHAFTVLEEDEVKVLPLSTVSAIHQDAHKLLLNRPQTRPRPASSPSRKVGINIPPARISPVVLPPTLLRLPPSFPLTRYPLRLQDIVYAGPPQPGTTLLAATRGIIPHVKWRTQEKSSSLGNILGAQATQMGVRRTLQPHTGVGVPFIGTSNLNLSTVRFGAIKDMVSLAELGVGDVRVCACYAAVSGAHRVP